MKKITDPTFVYRNSASTDLKATFARERRRLAKLAELQAKFPPKVTALRKEAK